MAKNADFSVWEARLQLAHDRWKKEVEPELRWVDWYRGMQGGAHELGRYDGYLVDNQVFSAVKTKMPRISFRRPKIYCRPRRPNRPGDRMPIAESARALEGAINYYVEDLKLKRQMDRALLDALLCPFGLVKLGYTLETDWIQDDELLEPNEYIKAESPYLVRWSPKNYRWDPEVDVLDERRWEAFRIVRPLEDVKRNKRFNHTSDLKPNVTIDLSPTSSWLTDGTMRGEVKGQFERVEMWELWDRKTHNLYVYAPGHGKFLFEEDWPFDLDGFASELLYFNEIPDCPVPLADTATYADQQKTLNLLSRMEVEHVRKSVPKYLYTDQIEESELDRLLGGEDSTFAKATDLTCVAPLPISNMTMDHQRVKDDMRRQIREIDGTTMFDRGGRENVQTATEASYIQGPSMQRADDRRSQFEDFWRRCVPKFAAIMRQFKTGEEFIPILGSDAAALETFLKFNPADIPQDVEKEFLFDIEVGSTEPLNDQVRQQKMSQLFEMLQGDTMVNQRELRRRLLEAFGERDERLLVTDEELAEQQQAAEMQAQQEQAAQAAQPPAGPEGAPPAEGGGMESALAAALGGVQ